MIHGSPGMDFSQFVFDFANPPSAGVTTGAGGHLVLASVADFPVLVGNGTRSTTWSEVNAH